MKYLKHLLTVLLLLVVFKAHAYEYNTLVVEMHDGSTTNFLLTHKPRITFTGEVIKIVSEQYSVEFTRTNIRKYYFAEETPTAITETLKESKAAIEGDILVVTGVAEDETISIYTTNGILVKQAAGKDGCCSISLNSLSSGTYIVTFNNTTFKFLKK